MVNALSYGTSVMTSLESHVDCMNRDMSVNKHPAATGGNATVQQKNNDERSIHLPTYFDPNGSAAVVLRVQMKVQGR